MAVEKRVTSPLLVRHAPNRDRRRLPRAAPAPGAPTPSVLSPAPQEPTSIEKVAEVDDHIGVAMSGLTADARTLIDHARVEAQQHRFTYNEAMPVESLTQSLCDLALRFGEDDEDGGGGGGMVRRRRPHARRARLARRALHHGGIY
jgi:hypothetical protein